MPFRVAFSFSRVAAAALILCALTESRRVVADDDAGAKSGVDGGAAAGAAVYDFRAEQIQSLLDRSLPVAVMPQSLFDVCLSDETAVQVERVRLKTMLQSIDDAADGGAAQSPPPKGARPALRRPPESRDEPTLSSPEWHAREGLDRARLVFYSLPRAEREVLLDAHAKRVEAEKPRETEAEERAREAEAQRNQALEAARVARSEAERLATKELARLIDVEQTVQALQSDFRDARLSLVDRKDSLLGWQHRVSEAKESTDSADQMYDAVRRTLRASRDDLDRALDEIASSASRVPDLGPDTLSDAPAAVSVTPVRVRRKRLTALISEAHAQEGGLRADRASTLLDEIDALNRDRLGLLSALSPAKRDGITGFTRAGLEQSQSEARQLLLILRYHRYVAAGWLSDLQRRQAIKGLSSWGIAEVLVPWVLAVVAFVWLRRRSPHWLAAADDRLSEGDRRERRTGPSLPLRALRFMSGFYRTAEWLLFFFLTVWMLPTAARNLLEVQLLEVIVGWTLAGALIVNIINSIASNNSVVPHSATDEVGRLRLRSLRLVGRVVVVFILVLLVSERLVGKGTVYSWVDSTSWFAAAPVFLILVSWWRETVFERVERVRRKSHAQTWILANRKGWKSFFAAMVAAVQLFAVGAYKVSRNWITSFDLVRRAHAYLFRRELARLANESPAHQLAPLSDETLAALAPAGPTRDWISGSSQAQIDVLAARSKARRGGVVAIIGARGMGKTSIARHLRSRVEGAQVLDCADGFSIESLRALAAAPCPPLLMLDNAQHLIRLVRDGLRAFDEVFAFARSHSSQTVWILAIDAVVWPFLSRARDSRPLFDEVMWLKPWTDGQVGSLLGERCTAAEVSPTFEDLLDKLPATADQIDKQEALAARRSGYFRMVWDYARGNPAIALEVWRASLYQDEAGSVRVGPLAAPEATQLELLPDSALFVLRAILQMDSATISEVARATRLPEAAVTNAVNFGVNHGYLGKEGDGVRIAWRWLRAIMVHLERRHLLVNP